MELGLVGKPNVGKSTLFGAITAAPVEAANYPFTTIEANRGIAHVRAPCPHVELGLDACEPNNAPCREGTRWVPVEVTDVAGLVPGAHEGKGLGNKFLDDLRQAAALVHVVDAAGSTNAEGEPVDAGSHDAREDVAFLEEEIEHWWADVLERDLDSAARRVKAGGAKVEDLVHERLSGLGVTEARAVEGLRAVGLEASNPVEWTREEVLGLVGEIRKRSRPILIAANKADLASDEQIQALGDATKDRVLPTSAESELALRKAAERGLVEYEPGGEGFEVTGDLAPEQEKGLELIRENVFARFGGTGVQEVLEAGVFEVLDRIVVYPVEDAGAFSDGEGNVLPDAFLVPRGTTARGLAYRVHTDIGSGFQQAIDARSNRTIGADHELSEGDVVCIVSDG